MNFKSQICTSREQSQKLLELGLKPETADMNYHHKNSRVPALEWELQPHRPTTKKTTSMRIERLNYGGLYKHKDGTLMSGEEVFEHIWGKDIPAWSLARLLEMIPMYLDVNIGMVADIEFFNDRGIFKILYTVHGYATIFGAESDNVYETMIKTIEWLIKSCYFTKEYLEV
ncbi:MAG: hypothetical protein Q4D56_06215 [Bacteroides sp.]|nr:hypothetical protein [Bacteroides sp.]